MRRTMDLDRRRRMVREAVERARMGGRTETRRRAADHGGQAGGDDEGGQAATTPIQDPDGNMYWMWGVSAFDGEDVFL